MTITPLCQAPQLRRLAQSPPPTPAAPEPGRDSVDLSSAPRKALGACGSLVGLCLGRLAPAAGAGTGGWLLGQAWAGTMGGVVGLAVGLCAGSLLEKKTRVGRLAGGLAGGAVGSALGGLAGAAGWQPGQKLASETRGFSLASLPPKLLQPNHTSHHRLTLEEAAPGMAVVQPGDVIITSDDEDFQMELMQKAIGASGDWTHAALVDEERHTLDIYITSNKPVRNPLDFVFTDNHHVSVLRPHYASAQSITRTLDYARAQFGNITYDHRFDLQTDDSQYCQEYLYKSLRHGAPEIQVPTHKLLGVGRDMVLSDEFRDCKDLDLVWSTGSKFGYNFLSKVT